MSDNFSGLHAGDAWLQLLARLVLSPAVVSPRGLATRELLGCKTVVPMDKCVMNVLGRKLGYKFMCAEAAWIMSGDNRVSTIAPFSRAISGFSDDNIRFFGAYGPRIVDQIGHIVKTLRSDPDSRQAVLTIWRQNPPNTKDTPCTISAQWMIRNGRLHCFMNMRSSDVWLGAPYDWFNFSMLSLGILTELIGDNGVPTAVLGNLHFYAASQHLYEKNFFEAATLLDESRDEPGGTFFNYARLDPFDFESYQEVVDHLWALARGGEVKIPWLTELRRLHETKS